MKHVNRRLLALALAFVFVAGLSRAYTCTKVSGDCTVGTPNYVADSSALDKLSVNVTGSNASNFGGLCVFWCTLNRTKGNATYGNFTGNYSDTSTFGYSYFCTQGLVCQGNLSCGLYRHGQTNQSILAYGTVAAGGCNYSLYTLLNGSGNISLTLQSRGQIGGASSYPPYKPNVYILVGAPAVLFMWHLLRRNQ